MLKSSSHAIVQAFGDFAQTRFCLDPLVWAGSVIESLCPSVCVFGIKVVIVKNNQSIKFFCVSAKEKKAF